MADKVRESKTTPIAIKNADCIKGKVTRYSCGGDGLYVDVRPTGKRSFVLRLMVQTKIIERGLGVFAEKDPKHGEITLADARKKARRWADDLREGKDLRTRKPAPVISVDEVKASMTFREAAETVFERDKGSWRSNVHRNQWINSMENHVFDVIGHVPIGDLTYGNIAEVMTRKRKEQVKGGLVVERSLWMDKYETACKVLLRISSVMNWAVAENLRNDNPALIRGPLKEKLPKRPASPEDEAHHAALPYDQLPAFIAEIQSNYLITHRALEFTILTGVRTSEAIGATWSEIDIEKAVWTIPAKRMKANTEHKVPLSKQAIALLEPLRALDREIVFWSEHSKGKLSNMAMLGRMRKLRPEFTVHGFRSTLADWAAEQTDFAHEIREAALAHKVPNAVERAYKRTTFFDKRRDLLQQWADFCYGIEPAPAEDATLRKLREAGLLSPDIMKALSA